MPVALAPRIVSSVAVFPTVATVLTCFALLTLRPTVIHGAAAGIALMVLDRPLVPLVYCFLSSSAAADAAIKTNDKASTDALGFQNIVMIAPL